MKILQNNKIIWEHETQDPKEWLKTYLINLIKKQEMFVMSSDAYSCEFKQAIEICNIKLNLLKMVEGFYYNDDNRFIINTDPYNSFSRGDEYVIIN